MKTISLILLTFITLKLSAQTHFLGIKGGANFTNINNTTIENNDRKGIVAGLTYEYQFKKHFSVGTDLLYTQRGFRNDVTIVDVNQNLIGVYSAKYNYNYISLPIKAGFHFGDKIFALMNIGVVPSYLINAKHIFPTANSDWTYSGDETYNVTKETTKFDFAGLGEIGAGYKLKSKYWLFAAFAYQRSFTTISNDEYFPNSDIKHNGISLSVGVKYVVK